MKILNLILAAGFVTIVFETSLAQSFSVGLNYGFGNATYRLVENSEELHRENFSRIGIPVSFSPFLSNFSIVSGTELEYRDIGNYLTIPAILRVDLGKTLKVYGECGLYYSFLLKKGFTEYIVDKDWGGRTGLGLIYSITKKWRVDLAYNFNYGFAESVKTEKQLPFEQIKIMGSKLISSYIVIGGRYRF